MCCRWQEQRHRAGRQVLWVPAEERSLCPSRQASAGQARRERALDAAEQRHEAQSEQRWVAPSQRAPLTVCPQATTCRGVVAKGCTGPSKSTDRPNAAASGSILTIKWLRWSFMAREFKKMCIAWRFCNTHKYVLTTHSHTQHTYSTILVYASSKRVDARNFGRSGFCFHETENQRIWFKPGAFGSWETQRKAEHRNWPLDCACKCWISENCSRPADTLSAFQKFFLVREVKKSDTSKIWVTKTNRLTNRAHNLAFCPKCFFFHYQSPSTNNINDRIFDFGKIYKQIKYICI